MHYIDQQPINVGLPGNWLATVTAARRYVAGKMRDAKQNAKQKGKTLQRIHEDMIKARKAAINTKASVWSQLKDLLEKQSNSKCWYCETTDIRSDHPVDHFRPKNRIAEEPTHNGYWWLAFDWENYRYCCTFCNSKRVLEDSKGGKHDHFPLHQPPPWARTPGLEKLENPMLLDPCDLDDPDLLAFAVNGEVKPANSNTSSLEYKRADISINLYHFNHKPTSRARSAIRVRIDELVKEIDDLIDAGVIANRHLIRTRQEELVRKCRFSCETEPFNTAARHYLKRYDSREWVKKLLAKL